MAVDGTVLGTSRALFLTAIECVPSLTSLEATALPRITTEFHSTDAVSWYGTIYQLAVVAFQPTVWARELFGRIDMLNFWCPVVRKTLHTFQHQGCVFGGFAHFRM